MTEPTTKRTRRDAGRLGGLKTKERHGTEHYRKVGKKGGRAVRKKPSRSTP